MVIDPIAEIECETMVTAAAFSPDANWLAWGGQDGVVRIIEGTTPLTPFNVDDGVTHLAVAAGDVIVVGTHAGDLHGHERLGGHRWTHRLTGGCDHLGLSADGRLIACIDGYRQLHVLDADGGLRGGFTAGELVRLAVAEDGTQIAVADDEGNVTVLTDSAQVLYRRGVSSEMGEVISAMGFLADGSLLLCREVLGITDAGDPQIALERWQRSRLAIEEVDSLATVIRPDGEGALVGFFDGQVLFVDPRLQQEGLWRSPYTVNDLRRCEADLLVASWFHLHRVSASGEHLWQCEHSGLVQQVHLSKRRLLLTGDNQNDYTRENRMLLLNADTSPYAMSEDMDLDEDLRDFAEAAPKAPPDDAMYADDDETIASLLTEEERELMHQRHAVDDSLFDMLDDEIEQLAMVQDATPELIGDFDDESFITHVPPTADAGLDQEVAANADGTAIVVLDGSATAEGSQGISQWIWRDGHSKQIGSTPMLKVRLPVGNHTFTLTVSDPARESSTDTVTVQVQGKARDETYDLLAD